MKDLKSLLLIVSVFVALLLIGFSNRKADLYENMVNASVLIRNDFNYGSGVFIYDNVIVTAAHVLEQSDFGCLKL